MTDTTAKRDQVAYRYDALNWDFLHQMARVASHSDTKHGDSRNYTGSRLTGDKSPINHAAYHIANYLAGKTDDVLPDLGRAGQLVKAAYNLMMEYHYETGTVPGDTLFPYTPEAEPSKDSESGNFKVFVTGNPFAEPASPHKAENGLFDGYVSITVQSSKRRYRYLKADNKLTQWYAFLPNHTENYIKAVVNGAVPINSVGADWEDPPVTNDGVIHPLIPPVNVGPRTQFLKVHGKFCAYRYIYLDGSIGLWFPYNRAIDEALYGNGRIGYVMQDRDTWIDYQKNDRYLCTLDVRLVSGKIQTRTTKESMNSERTFDSGWQTVADLNRSYGEPITR